MSMMRRLPGPAPTIGLLSGFLTFPHIPDYSQKDKNWWLFPIPVIPGLYLVLPRFRFIPE